MQRGREGPNAPSVPLSPLYFHSNGPTAMRCLIATLILIAATATAADASVRSYSLPTADGRPVSDCLADGKSCGKPAADLFCKKEGYAEAILFAREPVTAASSIDGQRQCGGPACEAFTRIKCYTPTDEDQASAE